jgi:hypothetical protein
MALDFDPTVVGIASQPFWLFWRDEAGKLISHAPDFFARRADGTSVVVDCRPVERRKPRDAAKFEATARACAMVGWNYRLVGVPDPIVTANLRWLAGYRHPRHDLPDVREVLRRVFVTPTPLMAGTAAAGGRSRCCRCCFICCGAVCWRSTYRCRCIRTRWLVAGRLADDAVDGGGAASR